jgi:hypothetical protein
VVFDDYFTTVPYLQTATVPPHWAKLVRTSSKIELFTEQEVGTWQSLPELDIDPGDFTSDTSNCEGDGYLAEAQNVDSHHDNKVTKRVTFRDQVQDIEIQSKLPDLSQTQPNKCQMPSIINLDLSGLRCSPRKEVLSWQDKIYSNSTTSFKQIKQGSKHACLVLFSSFCVVGAELTCGAHSLQDNVTSSSKFSNAIDSYHRVNLLCDGTINCFSTLALSGTASNETFTYKQALQEADYHKFVKAMIHEVDNNKSQTHWTLIKCCELPLGTKTIMSIWSFKRKQYPDGSLNKHKACLCAHGGMQN